jgi:predicted phage terminase large subunit-like protein
VGGAQTGQHYDVIIHDDLVNRDNIGTRDQIQKVITYYQDCLPLLDNRIPELGKIVVLGTTWFDGDLYSWIRDADNDIISDFDVMLRKAYVGEWGRGEILFPQKYSWSYLEELKRQMGSSSFSAQFLNDPVPAEDAFFKREMFHYYEPTDIRGSELNKFITVDPAISQEKESDYTAIVTCGIDKSGNAYVLDIVRDKLNPYGIANTLFELNEAYHPIKIGIEMVSFQQSLQFFLRDEMKKRGKYLPIEELKLNRQNNSSTKDMRIRGLQPRYEGGTIYHCKTVRNNEYLEDELIRFPKGEHDDVIDALSYQLQLWITPRKKEYFKKDRYLY